MPGRHQLSSFNIKFMKGMVLQGWINVKEQRLGVTLTAVPADTGHDRTFRLVGIIPIGYIRCRILHLVIILPEYCLQKGFTRYGVCDHLHRLKLLKIRATSKCL